MRPKAVVTVYEGKVRVVGGGAPVEVRAGQRATITPGDPVALTDVRSDGIALDGPGEVVAAAPPVVDDPTVASLSRGQLIARDRAQREQLAALGARVQQLEGAPRGGALRGGPADGEDFMNQTKAELSEWAKTCTIKIDLPPLEGPQPFTLSSEAARDLGLSDVELAAGNASMLALRDDWSTRLRGWYVEATGDAAGADTMSARAMGQELQDKAAPGEPGALHKRIAQERAGQLAAPTELGKASAYERYYRGLVGLGDEAERVLGTAIGADRAHQIRAHDGGWGDRMSMSGCDAD